MMHATDRFPAIVFQTVLKNARAGGRLAGWVCNMEEAILALDSNEEENVVLSSPLGLPDLGRFCASLKRCWKVTRLVLRGVHMKPHAVQAVMQALEGNATLKVLDLSFNELGDAGIKTAIMSLTVGDGREPAGAARSLHTLLLDSNGLDENGASVLALLGLQHPLHNVSLRCNRLGDRAALLLAGALPGRSKIEVRNFYYCRGSQNAVSFHSRFLRHSKDFALIAH